jgi:hypothetical protein
MLSAAKKICVRLAQILLREINSIEIAAKKQKNIPGLP